MDLHLTSDQPTTLEKQAIDSILGEPKSDWCSGEQQINWEGHASLGGHKARANRHLLLPVLHGIQSHVGWISPGALNYACQRLNVPPAEAFGVADFYALFSVSPRPPIVMHVCDDIACNLHGADELCQNLEETIGPPGSPGPSGKTTWERSPCLGQCERAPASLLITAGLHPYQKVLAPADLSSVQSGLSENNKTVESNYEPCLKTSIPQAGDPELRLLRRIGFIDPKNLDDYKAKDGYQALRKALKMGSKRVIQEVIDSKLLGRGGAAFPAGIKWKAVASAPKPHYLICNADESEPGTFKDRLIMEGDPFSVVEAITIAGLATDCQKGYIYLRGEYPVAQQQLENAIETARTAQLIGKNILGSGLTFDIEIRIGAGAYICGEETALFNSIEGFRGEPRNKPPFPSEFGLFGKPTVVNNVETLVNVLDIVLNGGIAYASRGTEQSTGTKLFCLSGHIVQPGLYEVPFGKTLREVIDLGGGISGSGRLQAVLLGGAAGSFLTPMELDIPLTFEGTRSIGASLGSAVVMPFDDTVDLRKTLLRIAAFFRDESCGKCVPCRVGSVRQEELLHRLTHNQTLGSIEEELFLLQETGQVMRDASICGLGQTASSAIESALARWKIFNGGDTS